MKKSAVFAVVLSAIFLTIRPTNHVAQAQGGQQLMGTNSYAAKFICGEQADYKITSNPDAQAGRYSTKINVHNNTGMEIKFRKKIIPLRSPKTSVVTQEIIGGGEVPRDPKFKVLESLKEDWAMEVVCKDIYKYLDIKQDANGVWPFTEGFVIFEVYCVSNPPTDGCQTPPDPLDVEGIYTYKGDLANNPNADGVSIDVVVYPAKSNRHILH